MAPARQAIAEPRAPGDYLYLFSPIAHVCNNWVGSKVPLVDHRTHSFPSHQQDSARALRAVGPVPSATSDISRRHAKALPAQIELTPDLTCLSVESSGRPLKNAGIEMGTMHQPSRISHPDAQATAGRWSPGISHAIRLAMARSGEPKLDRGQCQVRGLEIGLSGCSRGPSGIGPGSSAWRRLAQVDSSGF
jgi:hypothetical protein